MKQVLFNKAAFFYQSIPLSIYIQLSQQKNILPFYHAVTDSPKPHVKHLSYFRTTSNFLNDIDFFLQHYTPVSIENIKTWQKPSFHMNFDDGLAEIYDIIFPILLQNKIPATFFINSDFIDNKYLFYRHKLSILLEEVQNSINSKHKIASALQTELAEVESTLKALHNPAKIDALGKLLQIDFNAYLQQHKPYLTTNQLQELQQAGFTIGNHAKSHVPFYTLPLHEQQQQVQDVSRFIQEHLGVTSPYFSFPFGDEKVSNPFFDYLFNDAGIKNSFGISGLKKDGFSQHIHRIAMEIENARAEQIIKFQYFYFLLKALIGKNKVRR